VIPLDRVGIYVPGGTAAYPSSVIMNAVPAVVAGVREIIMMVPPKNGQINPYVLIAARAAGVKKIYKIGGAQAIAAMAFGTETIPRVDKITGPGNIFVTLAKKEVYGNVDIDMLAGPSEILIVADKTADPVYTAADMLSQAEHDPLASSIVITDDAELAAKVEAEVEKQLLELPRREIAQASIARNGLIVVADDMRQAIRFANVSAPEHLELLTAEPFQLLPYIRHAGAVFLGAYSPEPLGDYFAGPNHVLPTGGTARYYSVLNVETFMKRTSIISYTQPALQAVSEDIIRLAENEGLQAHANAIRLRRN
jgi:histidinol dehydrogenase